MIHFIGSILDIFRRRYRVASTLPNPASVALGTRIFHAGSVFEAFSWNNTDTPDTWSRIG